MDDVRSVLSHVLWIGGAPRTGKTTLSRLLAGKYDLKIYNLDWHQVREHRQRLDPMRHPVSLRWENATVEERWVGPSPEELLRRGIQSWSETFDLVIEDLLALPRARTILAEGPGAFPWCVAPLISSSRQAVFLVPSPDFRDRVLARRMRDQVGQRFGDETSDPERARANLRERDLLLAEEIRSTCDGLELRWLEMDDALDLDATVAVLEKHFEPHLPKHLNV